MPLRRARAGRVGVIGAPVARTAVVAAAVTPGPSPGEKLAKSQERKLSIRDRIAIERGGDNAATVHKALVGIRDRFAIDVENGADMKAHGNIVDHEYEIERDGDTVATISKKWFRV